MPHPKDNEVWPFGTKVYRPKTRQKGIIVDHTFLKDGKNFLHYLVKIEGKEGNYCWLHDEIERLPEHLPDKEPNNAPKEE